MGFSLDKKLIVLVLAVSMVTIIATAALSLNLVDGILKDRIGDQLIDESAVRGNAIKLLLDNRIKEVFVFSSSSLIKDTISDLNEYTGTELEARILEKKIPVLVQIRNFQIGEGNQIELIDVAIFGKDLKEYFTLDGRDKFPSKERVIRLANSQMMEFFQDSEGKRWLIVAMPIKDEQNQGILGVVAAIMGTENLDRILEDKDRLQDAKQVYLVNQDRQIISESIFTEYKTIETLPVSACFEQHRSIKGTVYENHLGNTVFGTSYCQSEYGYVVLTEVKEGKVLSPLFDLQEKIIIVSTAIMIGISSVTYMLSRRLSKPIRRLSDAAREISDGNFDVKTDIKTSDEIGELSSSFDSMAKRLLESEIVLTKQKEIIKQQEDMLLQFSDHVENACVCLIDIENSTKICAKLSESQANNLYSGFLNSMANIVKTHNGTVVKNIGDALLFYFKIDDTTKEKEFKNVLECCMALIDYHGTLCGQLKEKKLPCVNYRISSTFGPVSIANVATSEVNDVFGSTVNLCSKINSFASSNGLVIGDKMYEKSKSIKGIEFVNISDFEISENQDLKIFSVNKL